MFDERDGQRYSSYVGGLVDYNNNTIKTSGSTAAVSGGDYVGRLVGANDTEYNQAAAQITNCYAQGNVTGTGSNVGGLLGYNAKYAYSQTPCSIVKNCYAVDKVLAGGAAGGFVGANNGDVINSYYNSDTSGQTDMTKGTLLSTGNMKIASS